MRKPASWFCILKYIKKLLKSWASRSFKHDKILSKNIDTNKTLEIFIGLLGTVRFSDRDLKVEVLNRYS